MRGTSTRRQVGAEMERLLRDAVTSHPNDASLWCRYGAALRGKGDLDAALNAFNAAIRIDPSSIRAFLRRGATYQQLKAFDRAIEDYTIALSMDKQHAPTHYALGTLCSDRGLDSDAIGHFSEAISLDPEWPLPHFWRAGAYREIKRFGESLRDYTSFIRMAKHQTTYQELMAEAYGSRAFVHKVMGNYEEAVADYSRELELNPDSALAHLGRSSALEGLGDPQHAAADLSKAVEIDPSVADEP